MNAFGTLNIKQSEKQFLNFTLSNWSEMYDLNQSIAWFQKSMALFFFPIVDFDQFYQISLSISCQIFM